jgi:outer membrane lipoprotein-sorting protein
MKLPKIAFVLLITQALLTYSQEIITAERYLETVSTQYSAMRDYEARIVIRSGTTDMYGTVSYLSPAFMRIDFTTPAGQVIVFNGEQLTIYLPAYQAILNQSVTSGGASMASGQGLALMRRNYVPSFVTGPSAQPLEAGSGEQVVKLRLTRRSSAEGFREIILSVSPESRLIRRIEGTTLSGSLVRFDYSGIKINQGIPAQRFIYDSPPSANMYNDFLFRDTD